MPKFIKKPQQDDIDHHVGRKPPHRATKRVKTRIVCFGRSLGENRGSSQGPKYRDSPCVVPVHLMGSCKLPEDYHCHCQYCKRFAGELRKPDGGYYSRLERKKYYSEKESGKRGHVAKTPVHIARWAIQNFTRKGEWVFDPTAGAGTTLVEALAQGRNAAGMEIQFENILSANLRLWAFDPVQAIVGFGDARRVGDFLERLSKPITLMVNNPPYSGDEHWSTFNVTPEQRKKGIWSTGFYAYNRGLANIAFLKKDEYWETIGGVYRDCLPHLQSGGYFVIGVKDQMRQKKPDFLHRSFGEVLEELGLVYLQMVLLKHYPKTLHLNTYFKRYGAHPPYYQTILVFRKE